MKKIFDDPILNSIADIDLDHIVNFDIKNVDISKFNQKIYEALISSIISQQISTAAARSIKKKFTEYFGNRYPIIDEVLNIEIEKLRGLGLSIQKANYIKSVAEFFKNLNQDSTPSALTGSSPRGALNSTGSLSGSRPLGRVGEGVSDEDLIKELTKIKGVGRWTVEMILIFTLGRSDVFAIDDLALCQAVIKLYKLKKTKTLKKRILKISERWSPNRSLASRYLWKWRDRNK